MRRITVIAPAIAAVLALAACSGGAKDQSADPSRNTLQPGMTILPGSIESEKVEGLSPECEKAVKPLRGLMTKYKSGLEITDAADNSKLTEYMNAAAGECKDEYSGFYEKELLGWLNAEPGRIPAAVTPGTTPPVDTADGTTSSTKPASKPAATTVKPSATTEKPAETTAEVTQDTAP